MPETCRNARDEVEDLEIEQGPKSFFPLNELRSFFKEQKIREILLCECTQCKEDLRMFNSRIDRENYVDMIMGGPEPKDLTRTYYSVFGLLVYVEHPLFIIGFLDHKCNDYILESWATLSSDLSPDRLKTFTGEYKRNATRFDRFARKFTAILPRFAIPHLEPDRFSHYHESVVLPFIEEVEIGKKRADDGHLTSEGANGRVFAFKIQREYNRFPHSGSKTEFARKRIETTQPLAYLERSNIQYVQQFEDDHIVKLIKAYGHGESINLIFPRAWTNLDHLLRNRLFGYGDKRGAKLELADAWKQLLGISKALRKIHGFGNSRANGGVDDQLCIHFDLKPDNILIEREDGNWLITDFGQAALTRRRRGTTPRVGGHFGTDAYAPPEIDDTSMEFGRAYDIWSLGCIMLEVATFMVLGHAGLSGSGSFVGLDQTRQAMPKWARNSDERFFCQEVPNGEYVVKKEIQAFMVNLESSHARSSDCDDESKAFLKKVIGLINRMLKPKVTERVDITRVVEILSSARRRASAGVIEQKPHQVVAEPGEHILQESELSRIELLHWSAANKEWEECKLAILESEAGFMRLHCWAQGRIPKDINLPRNGVKMLPLYAFWDPTKIRGSKAWIDLLALSAERCSAIPNAKFAFDGGSGLDEARLVQSVLTSQDIVGSFALSRVMMSRPNSATAVLSRAYRRMRSSSANTPTEADSRSFDMNSATVQIWVEQQDALPTHMTRRESQGSQTTSVGRPVRRSDRDRSKVPPCRLCIYLHEPQFICTVRIDVNWVLEEGTSINKVHLKPRTSGGSGTFYASWLRPTPTERAAKRPAGIPLDPRVLRYYEDSDSIELEDVELTFLNADVLAAFRSKYDDTKEAWANERTAKEDRAEVNGKPEGTPRVPDGAARLPVPKVRVSILAGTAEQEDSQSTSSASATRSRHDSTMENRVGLLQNPSLLIVPPNQ